VKNCQTNPLPGPISNQRKPLTPPSQRTQWDKPPGLSNRRSVLRKMRLSAFREERAIQSERKGPRCYPAPVPRFFSRFQ
jgi:hypothetical protein